MLKYKNKQFTDETETEAISDLEKCQVVSQIKFKIYVFINNVN